MTLKAEVTLEWADGEFSFALRGAQIEELQRLCGNVGFGAIYQRVMLGVWMWGDLYHTVRLGLIGGGMGPVDAKRKCDMYIDGEKRRPLVNGPDSPESVARAIMQACMHGMETLDPGEHQPEGSPDGLTSQNTEPHS